MATTSIDHRRAQAERNVEAILDAAERLLRQRSQASIAAVAKEAGVSPETIYVSLGGKRGLLEGVIETAISGDEDRAAEDEAWWAEVAELPDAGRRLERNVEYSCDVLARTRPIHAVIRVAADQEAFASALGHRLLQERLAEQTQRVRRYLGCDLRAGLSISQAGQRYCALASPELYYLLTVELGWTAEQHRRWLTDLLKAELLG